MERLSCRANLLLVQGQVSALGQASESGLVSASVSLSVLASASASELESVSASASVLVLVLVDHRAVHHRCDPCRRALDCWSLHDT